MKPDVDLICGAFIGEIENIPEEDGPDVFTKLFQDGALAAALGKNGHQTVAGLHEETSVIDRHADEVFKRDRSRTAPQSDSDPDTPLTRADSILRKFAKRPEAALTKISPNGTWEFSYNQSGELISGREIA